MVVPVLVLGVGGLLYYQHAVKENIDSENLAHAKAMSALTENYVALSQNYLDSIAARPLVISAVKTGDPTYLKVSASYAAMKSQQFQSVFATDASGKVLSYNSEYPDNRYTGEVGKNYSQMPVVSQVLNTSNPYVSDGLKDAVDGTTTVYIGVPVLDNNTVIGTLVGSMDLWNLTSLLLETRTNNDQYISIVNKSGNVMVHSNRSYAENMADFSAFPAVQNVMKGQQGVVEGILSIENEDRLAAYSPISKYGWGVVVSIPSGVAYQPITQSTRYLTTFLIALLLGAILLSIIFGDYITRPLLHISDATAKIPAAGVNELERELPLGRKDELGNVARSVLAMAKTIGLDRERLISARDAMEKEKERAEDEKQRAELYVDIMGHDINNLNQSALANMEIVQSNANLTENEKEMINNAITSVMSSAGIIDNVRKIQKITGEEIHGERVDIDQMIQACINEAHRPEGKTVTIRYSPKKGLYVVGTPLLKEVFCNLIDNSIKYSRDEVEIDILVKETQTEGRRVYETTISDNGYGIPDETKQKLFKRFQRGTTKAHGKGLGLYIVKKLIEKFGGSIQIENRVPGDYSKGTLFTITLPVAEGV